LGLVLEIKTIVHLANLEGFFVRVVSKDELFEEQKCPLVVHSLANLDESDPLMRGPGCLAVFALLILNGELYHELLLQHGVSLDFLLYGQPNFDATRMGFRPDKRGVQ
jgi:hypothetical protein